MTPHERQPLKIGCKARLRGEVAGITTGRLQDSQPSAWFDQWRDMDHLPDLVHVTIWRAGHADTPWLEFSAGTGDDNEHRLRV